MPEFPSFGYDIFEFEPCISPAGDKLYYGSRRPLPGNKENNQSADIWVVTKTKDKWSEPEYIGSNMMYVSVAANGNLYYTGMTEGASMRGICKMEYKNGDYSEPIFLRDEVNFMPGTAHPYIAPDESYLIFDAQPKGAENTPDLFISFKKDDGTWTKAINMGEEINKGREMCASVSPDGKYFFFSRDGDIYWVDAKIIENLKYNK